MGEGRQDVYDGVGDPPHQWQARIRRSSTLSQALQRMARSEESPSCRRRMEEAGCGGCARADARACMRSGPKEGRVRNRS